MPDYSNLGFSLQSDHEEEIDLVNLIGYVLRRWRKLLVIALIGCLLGGLFGHAKWRRLDIEPGGADYDCAMMAVENLNTLYGEHKAAQFKASGYLANLNENIPYYSVNVSYCLSYPMEASFASISSILDIRLDVDAMAQLQELLGIAPEDRAPDDMFCISDSYTNSFSEFSDSRVLTCSLSYIAESNRDAALEFLDNWMADRILRIILKNDGAKLIQVTHEFTQIDGESIAVLKEALNKQVQDSKKAYTALVSAVTTNKSSQFGNSSEFIIAEHNRQINSIQVSGSTFKDDTVTTAKYAAIGLFAFICLGGLWLVAKYMLMNRIHSVGELSNTYGMKLIGYIPGKPSTDWLDKKLRKIIEPTVGAKAASSCEYLLDALPQMNMDRICLSQVTMTTASTALCNALRAGGANSIRGELHRDGAFLKEACRCGKVVLVVTLEETSHTDIRVALEVCRLHHIEVAGVIIVENTYC